MKKKLAVLFFVFFCPLIFLFWQTFATKTFSQKSDALSELKPQSRQAAAFAISERVSNIASTVSSYPKKSAEEKAREIPNNKPFRKQIPNATPDSDANLQNFSLVPMPTPLLTFDGLSSNDNANTYGNRIVPPDTNGDIGLTQYVQVVNSLVRVYDKNGNPQSPPFKLSSLFSTLGTPCSTRDDGDIIVLYDSLADRWILSQYCTFAPPFRQMIAVSQTGDATGSYFIYEFIMPNNKLNDYSKFGVWTDGYYMSSDEFVGSDYVGSGAFAFDRNKMLRGDRTASYVYFDLASPSTIRFGGLLPADIDGLLPPQQGTAETFVGYSATEYGDTADAITLFDFRPNFANPFNSTFTQRSESPISVPSFDPTSTDGRADIFPPAPAEALDSQSDRLMYRVAYRNQGDFDYLTFNQTVRSSPIGQTYRAGVRVHQLRRNLLLASPLSPFVTNTSATVGDNSTSRWMASAAQDWQGNIAVGYSLTNQEKVPSIVYSGKLASETTFRNEEFLFVGTGVQTAFGFRWGDYSAMNVDVVDDCTFYYTNQYYSLASQEESAFGWLTRIGKFRFNECTNAPRSTINGIVTNATTSQPIANAQVTAALYSRGTSANGSFSSLLVLPNTYTITASAFGYQSQTVTITVANGQILTQNFALQPTAVLVDSGTQITSESCAVNGTIDQNETVTINLALRNTGSRNTTNLTATLQPTNGVINPSSAQLYGALTVNGASVSRPFTFTASPSLLCGDSIVLTLNLQDGTQNLGQVSFPFNVGKRRIAFAEDFDGNSLPNLPKGWSTSATGVGVNWVTTEVNFETPPNSVFTSTPNNIGTNELVSPSFSIVSPNAELEFRNRYDLESTFLRNRLYDGTVLEIKIGNGAWQDILSAGGTFLSGGYNGTIDSCCQNPLAGRLGWSGKSGINNVAVFITSKAKLPASAAGQNVRLRWRLGTDIGGLREGQFIDDIKVTDEYQCCNSVQNSRTIFDFDGDGKTDLSVFRPTSTNNLPDFLIRNSSNSAQQGVAWGTTNDVAANADYDGDGKTDFTVFRPSTNTWFILRSSDSSIIISNFGLSGDQLTPSDFDGDSKADIAVFRPSNGTWYVIKSTNGQVIITKFGINGDLPTNADFDADGKTDFAVFRPSDGNWYVLRSSDGGFNVVKFGLNGDKPVVGDFDGDNKADFVVYRPSDSMWYLLKTTQGFSAIRFGISTDFPLQADFDGDGKRDIAVYRAANNVWYWLKSSDSQFNSVQFGQVNDLPVPTIFVR
jgi:Carboxypeptidase regulatory-like domain